MSVRVQCAAHSGNLGVWGSTAALDMQDMVNLSYTTYCINKGLGLFLVLTCLLTCPK